MKNILLMALILPTLLLSACTTETATVTTPPITVTAPPTTVTAPPTTVTAPPTTVTVPPTTVTAPPTTVTAPPTTVTAPPITVTAPPITVTAPPITMTAPPITVTAPPITVTAPPITITVTPPPPAELYIVTEELSYQITNKDIYFWYYSWQISIKNMTFQTLALYIEIQFLDANGFIVEWTNDIVEFNSQEEKTLRGTAMVDVAIAANIVSAVADIEFLY